MHGGCPDHIPTAEELLARKLKPGERILWKSRPAERYWTFPVARRMFFGTILLVYPWCFILAVWRDAGHFWEGELPGSLLYFSLAGVIAGGIPAMLALAGRREVAFRSLAGTDKPAQQPLCADGPPPNCHYRRSSPVFQRMQHLYPFLPQTQKRAAASGQERRRRHYSGIWREEKSYTQGSGSPAGSRGYPETARTETILCGTGKINIPGRPRRGEDYSPPRRIRTNSRRVVRTTRHSSSTAATVRPTMNPIQTPRAPMAGTIQSVRARM